MQKQDARRLAPSAQEAIRLRCVNAVADGMTQTEAARTFGVCRQSVNEWVAAHAHGGARALRAKKRGRRPGQGAKLLPWQAAATVRLIQDRCPDQLKLPFVLWTREAVATLIAHKWGVRFSLMQVGRYLKRWGFTPQKPVRRAYERDAQAVAHWLRPRIRPSRGGPRRRARKFIGATRWDCAAITRPGRVTAARGKRRSWPVPASGFAAT